MKVIKYRKADKEGALRAHFSCQIETKYGDETIHGCSLFMQNGKRWVNLPDRKVEKDGEIQFFPYVSLAREGMDQFRVDAINAIEKFCAEAQLEFLQPDFKVAMQYKDKENENDQEYQSQRKALVDDLQKQVKCDFPSQKLNTSSQNQKHEKTVAEIISQAPIQSQGELPF